MQPFVSIIIPCRNEERFISKCLNSVVANDYSKRKMEVLVMDGMSKDRTRKIIKKYESKYSFIKLLDNPKKIKPCALNIGIKKAKGKIVMIMDAHSTYKKDYISKCLKFLEEYKADNVGGIVKTISSKNTVMAKAITISLSHPFGVGGSYFRKGSKKPREVDTVFGGCYRKKVFKKIGFFNENLIRSQDMEFNLRLKKAGGKILLAPEIVAYYYPNSNFRDFFIHNFKDGIWAIYPFKFVKVPLHLRHYLPLIFVLSLLLSLIFALFFFLAKVSFISIFGSYLLLSLFFSLKISSKKGLKYFFALLFVFAARHIGYGLGSIFGLIKIFM